MRRRLLLAAVLALPVLVAPAGPSSAQAPAAGNRIDHLVVVIEQNSTFDHTFGTFPLVDGLRVNRSVPQDGVDDVKIRGFSGLGPSAFSVDPGEEVLTNGASAARAAFANGSMEGFFKAEQAAGKNPGLSFTVLDQATPTPWRRLVGKGVLFDNYFSTTLGGSLPNTMSLVAGSSYGFDQPSTTDLTRLWHSHIPTIFDAAQKTLGQVSWKFYVGGLDQIDPRKIRDGSYAASAEATPSQLYWAPILSMKRFWNRPELAANVRNQNDFFQDAARGDLPNITYILPQPTSHEPLVLGPDLRLLSVINAVRTSPDWEHTALLVTWDDWGGYFDHVSPPTDDGHQFGFRVPLVLFSPWAAANQPSNDQLDHSSIPDFAAQLFGLTTWQPEPWTRPFPTDVWTDTPSNENRVVALSHPDHYVAAGMQHAPSVFILYLLTIVLIVGCLFVVGVTMRAGPTSTAPPPKEGTEP